MNQKPPLTFGPACATCKHLLDFTFRKCAAFPAPFSIPIAIMEGKIDHTDPVRGDHGIQYEADKDAIEALQEARES